MTTRKRGNPKLTADDVRLIRALGNDTSPNPLTHKQIAEKFEVSKRNITSILNFETWRHVA